MRSALTRLYAPKLEKQAEPKRELARVILYISFIPDINSRASPTPPWTGPSVDQDSQLRLRFNAVNITLEEHTNSAPQGDCPS